MRRPAPVWIGGFHLVASLDARIRFLILIGLIVVSNPAMAQEFVRAGQIAGIGHSVAVDAAGNTYHVGRGAGFDAYVAKLDPAGGLVWVRSFGGSGAQVDAYRVAVDPSGNVITTGYFCCAAADFDPGPGVHELTPSPGGGNGDIFISKLDAGGNYVWAGKIGGNGLDEPGAVAVDASGQVYLAGSFFQSADVDPGPGTRTMNAAAYDTFICKLDPAGALVWAKQLVGSATVKATGIGVDANGKVYIAGWFGSLGSGGSMDLDPGTVVRLVTAVEIDVFALALDSGGNFVWGWDIGAEGWDAAYDLALDASGNVTIVGNFVHNVDFDPGPSQAFLSLPPGARLGFVARYGSDGRFIWAKALGWRAPDGMPNLPGIQVAHDGAGNLVLAGTFSGSADFDPGPATYPLASAGSDDAFLVKLDDVGNLVWARRFGGTGQDRGFDVAGRANGNVIAVGSFVGTVDFDPGSGTHFLTDTAGSAFVVELRQIGAGSIPDGRFVDGVPLTLGKAGSMLELQWGASCSPADPDYEVYEGALGSFTTHVPVLCSTGGLTMATIMPIAADTYYLVVPRNGQLEGSYGKNSSGQERPPSAVACLPRQTIGNCP